MKLYKLYVVLSLWATGSLGLASCSDFLKEEPYAFVGPDQLGNDNAAVDLWLTGVVNGETICSVIVVFHVAWNLIPII